ncbi:MAG: cobyrinate a,c-diamide synthase [Desulfobulbus sp.]|nr:cobyrinate a,c-diamide synthase [Desulfobulbus sp.]
MNFPALLIAGTHSGCGKTTLTLGVMAALARRGLAVQPFKCGPDFIDPSLHRMVTGRISRNLDVRMCGAEFVHRSFNRNGMGCDCAVVEGVMGLFDGGEGSAAHLAKTLGLPVVLVIDVRSAAESVAAVAHGFATLDPGLRLAGIICNRVGSDKHQQMITEAIETHCTLPIIGFLPRNEAVSIPARHLGLHMGEEHPLKGEGLDQLVSLIEHNIDLDRLINIAAQRAALAEEAIVPLVQRGPAVRIGVARDAAFCFYYEDNLDLLKEAGAELVYFSPLTEAELPPALDGLYLGGGYPELYAPALSGNTTLREQIRGLAESGRPVYAECGGFMYLCASITDQAGANFPMVGLYPFSARMQPRLRSLGYRQPMVEQDCLLAARGTVLHGHEFHYSTIENAATFPAAYHLADGRSEGFLHQNSLAGYIHLHWGRTPEAAARFVQACRQPS